MTPAAATAHVCPPGPGKPPFTQLVTVNFLALMCVHFAMWFSCHSVKPDSPWGQGSSLVLSNYYQKKKRNYLLWASHLNPYNISRSDYDFPCSQKRKLKHKSDQSTALQTNKNCWFDSNRTSQRPEAVSKTLKEKSMRKSSGSWYNFKWRSLD